MHCAGCRWWSDQHAELTLNGTRARCLNEQSHHHGTMILGHHGCAFGEAGDAIDLPDMNRPLPPKPGAAESVELRSTGSAQVCTSLHKFAQAQEPRPSEPVWWRIEILIRDKEGREAWRDALATQLPDRDIAEKLIATLRTRRPKRQYRLVRNVGDE